MVNFLHRVKVDGFYGLEPTWSGCAEEAHSQDEHTDYVSSALVLYAVVEDLVDFYILALLSVLTRIVAGMRRLPREQRTL